MRRAGYLLIEMIVVLAIVATISIILASMHASIIQWHKQAAQYAMATNLATTTLSLLQNHKNTPVIKDFTITVDSITIDRSIPFTLHTITVSFKTPRGIEKKVSIIGGALHGVS